MSAGPQAKRACQARTTHYTLRKLDDDYDDDDDEEDVDDDDDDDDDEWGLM